MDVEAVFIEAECPEPGSRRSWSSLRDQPWKVSHCSAYHTGWEIYRVKLPQKETS